FPLDFAADQTRTAAQPEREAVLEEAARRLEREWPGPASNIVRALKTTPTPAVSTGGGGDLTNWLHQQKRLSLEFYSPIYGDDDDQAEEWRVHRQSGGINDREWEIVGRGITPSEALADARSRIRGERPA